MSRRSLITRADAIDRDQRRRTMGATMWSEAPVAPTAAAVWAGDGGGGGWDPGWADPLTSWVADLWAEVGYTIVDPLASAIADLWAEVGYQATSPGDPLLAFRGAQLLAEVAHLAAAGQRTTVGLLIEVAVGGTLTPTVKPTGALAAQTLAEVAVREQTGQRMQAGIIVEVAGTWPL